MCDPISFASFAIGAAGQVAGFMGAKQEADRQNQLAENNRIEANKAASDQYAQIQERMLQEKAAAGQQLEQGNLEAVSKKATATVAAGEAGVTGISVNNIIADFNASQGKFERTTQQNLAMTQDQLKANMDGVKSQAEGRINSVQKVAKPSFLPYAIGIASSATNIYSQSEKSAISVNVHGIRPLYKGSCSSKRDPFDLGLDCLRIYRRPVLDACSGNDCQDTSPVACSG